MTSSATGFLCWEGGGHNWRINRLVVQGLGVSCYEIRLSSVEVRNPLTHLVRVLGLAASDNCTSARSMMLFPVLSRRRQLCHSEK